MEAVKTWPEGSLDLVRSTSMWPRQGFSSLENYVSGENFMIVEGLKTYVRTNSIPWVSRDDSVDSDG